MSEPRQIDLVVAAGAVVTMDAERRILRDAAVAIDAGKVVAVGRREEILAAHSPERLIESPEGLVTPGLIDSHNHPAGAYLIKGLCDDLPQMQRLGERVVPHENQLTEEEAYVASLGSFAEMLRCGTTCFVDAGGPQTAGTARAAEEIGIRGILVPKIWDLPGPFGKDVVPDTEEIIAIADEAMARFDGAANGRLRVWYDLDAPDWSSDELIAAMADRARANGAGIVSHLINFPPREPGAPTRSVQLDRLEAAGLLDDDFPLLLAHINWLDEDDISRLATSSASVAHCPGMSLLGGTGWVAHGVIPDLVAAGGNLTIGTDAAAICRFLDLVRVMYLAACAHKDARRDPLIMGAYQAFEMGTVNAAKAMRREGEIGCLVPGSVADLVVFDASDLAFSPNRFRNPIPDLVYAASGSLADLVVIDGKVVVEGGELQTVDTTALAEEIDRVADPALERLGFFPESRWPIV